MLGSIVSGIASAIIGWLVKGLVYFGVYRAGEAAQASKDQAATLKGAEDANKLRDKVAGESNDQLAADLSQFMRGSPGDR
jgi:hypothetical protein